MQDLTDSCLRCLERDVPPAVDAEDYRGNPHTSYRCPRCRHVWATRRVAEPAPDYYAAHDDLDAWEAEDDFSDYDGYGGWR